MRRAARGGAGDRLAALPSEERAWVTFLSPDPLAAELEPGAFAACAITDLLARCPQPELVIRVALRVLRPGGTLAIAVPFGDGGDVNALHAFCLSSFVALVRSLCDVAELSLSDDSIRFMGVNRPPSDGHWERFSPESMLAETEAAAAALKRRLQQALTGQQLERIKTQANIRYRIGELIVEAVKHPWQALGLPARLLRLYRDRRSGKLP